STESVFKTISHYNNGRIISVFGCGGNRSRLRRYAMGDIISKNSDITIVTSDNSRFEKLDDIISDIYVGIKSPKGEVITIKDRKSAINYALSAAKSNDIVLLLGKGNQDYEEINGVKYPFDERLVVADYFKKASK
ncbi:MAG: cyanophycin synthetase, partial [Clostridia bacterium]